MDISDILREADPSGFNTTPQATRDLYALTRAWVAERSSPEILSWPTDGLIERVNDRIRDQIEKVEEMTGDLDPKTNFSLILIQTDLERWKYLARGFLRARIAKIDKHILHYLSTPDLLSRLSPSEITYATRHQELLHQHCLSSFLGSFPVALQRLDDNAGGISMVDTPDLDTAVFVRVLRDCVVEGRGRDEDDMFEAGRGDIVVTRWADVKELVERGEVELI